MATSHFILLLGKSDLHYYTLLYKSLQISVAVSTTTVIIASTYSGISILIFCKNITLHYCCY